MPVKWPAVAAALAFGLIAVGAAWALGPSLRAPIAGGAVALAGWCAYRGFVSYWDAGSRVVLRLWGLEWTRDEACSHFFITGVTGSGKTARAVMPIIHGLRTTLPGTGILAVDSKGVLWQPLSEMARALGQESDLRLIRVRPTYVPVEEWTPPLRLNLLADRSVPWTTYAKMIIDTATAVGQRGGQSFFKETTRDAIAHAMQALSLTTGVVTLDAVHDLLCTSSGTSAVRAKLTELAKGSGPSPKAARVEEQFFTDFLKQPPEQLGGTIFTIGNYLRAYTPPDIAEVFCSREPNFTLDEIDQGRLVCLSVPQVYQQERRYLNLLCKQLFFLHAFRRFDLERQDMARRNVIVLVLDEGQKTTLVSKDGFADHMTVDELREARVCLISATQTPLSLYASFETERKADVFVANLRMQIHFRAADEQGAKIVSAKMGGREMRKYSGGVSGGKRSRSWQMVDEPWFKPNRLLSLPEGHAVVKHPRCTGRPMLRSLPFTAFTRRNESGDGET